MAYAEHTEPEIEDNEQAGRDPLQVLTTIMEAGNIAEVMDTDKLAAIALKAMEEYRIDKESRKEWETRNEEGMKLAMLVAEEKDYPFKNAANVKYPLLTVAALQFNARAYPAIVQGDKVVKVKTWGEDAGGQKAARAKRVSDFMSYQLLSKIPEWEEDTDKLLIMLPIAGCVFRKVYYDPGLMRTATRLVTADRLVVNYRARSITDVPRITEEMHLYPYEIEERIRSGRFVEFEYPEATPDEEEDQENPLPSGDDDSPHMFLEQHRLIDLDEDGYAEPYIVTIHKSTAKIVRIVANFEEDTVTLNDNGVVSIRKPRDYYIKYPFMPSPDGGFYDWGFGYLLKDIGESINTTLNQMLDAGHLANMQGGLISSAVGLREKTIRLAPGEWRTIQTTAPLNQAVMPIVYPGPSAELFNLLGLLIDSGREVANIKDILLGEQNRTQTATTTLALIEQGMQLFNAIYKRIHRALQRELEIHSAINEEWLDPEEYAAFFDAKPPELTAEQQAAQQGGQPGPEQEPLPTPAEDFNMDDMDIMPVSDPQVASRTQELARAEFLREWAMENPLANQPEVQRRILQAAQIEDVDKLIVIPQPDPMEDHAQKLMLLEQETKIADIAAAADEKLANVKLSRARAIQAIATAEGQEAGSQLGQYKMVLDTLVAEIGAEQKDKEIEQRGISGVEGKPGNGAGPQNSGQASR